MLEIDMPVPGDDRLLGWVGIDLIRRLGCPALFQR
jgi:hypothetical protein